MNYIDSSLEQDTAMINVVASRKAIKEEAYNKPGVTVHFLKGRLRFENNGQPVGRAPFPSMICIFNNVDSTKCSFNCSFEVES